MENDALSLEYKRDYGTARRDLDVTDLINNPGANGVCRVFRLSFPEQGVDLLGSEARVFFEDRTDSLLVRHDSIEAFPQ